jgi:hypothetical protein
MPNETILTFTTGILLALFGYLATYFSSILIDSRKEYLARINRQLSEFYGPLFAITSANDSAWAVFRLKNRPNGAFFDPQNPPTADELADWRLWMTSVFMAGNSKIYELILTKSDLIIETDMPTCLLELCAHVASYKTVLEKWQKQDFSEHIAAIDYPTDLLAYSQQSYTFLKNKQAKLLFQLQRSDKKRER